MNATMLAGIITLIQISLIALVSWAGADDVLESLILMSIFISAIVLHKFHELIILLKESNEDEST